MPPKAPKTKLTSFVPRLIFRSAMAGVIPACAVSCGNVSPSKDGSGTDTAATGGSGGGAAGGASGAGGGAGGTTGRGGTSGGDGGSTGRGGSGGGAGGAAGGGGAGGNRDGGVDTRDAGRDNSLPDIRIIVLAIFGFANPPAPDQDDAPASGDWLRGLDELGPTMASAAATGTPAKGAAAKRRARRSRA